jgi:anthranilate phosphoribosyltransferase
VSSKSGSADFLEAIGYKIKSSVTEVENEIVNKHFAFLFAPNFHPAAKAVAPIRKELGVRTVFNLLGPLANPARVKRQMIGVFHRKWLEPLAQTLAHCGSLHTLTVHGSEGIDEISAYQETLVYEYQNEKFEQKVFSPEDFGVKPVSLADIHGGTAEENARKLSELAEGKHPSHQVWIAVNSAPAFYLAKKVKTLKEGTELAFEIIKSGRLRAFIEIVASA